MLCWNLPVHTSNAFLTIKFFFHMQKHPLWSWPCWSSCCLWNVGWKQSFSFAFFILMGRFMGGNCTNLVGVWEVNENEQFATCYALQHIQWRKVLGIGFVCTCFEPTLLYVEQYCLIGVYWSQGWQRLASLFFYLLFPPHHHCFHGKQCLDYLHIKQYQKKLLIFLPTLPISIKDC